MIFCKMVIVKRGRRNNSNMNMIKIARVINKITNKARLDRIVHNLQGNLNKKKQDNNDKYNLFMMNC